MMAWVSLPYKSWRGSTFLPYKSWRGSNFLTHATICIERIFYLTNDGVGQSPLQVVAWVYFSPLQVKA